MHGLDAWLEAPYVDAARRQDDFDRWCETHRPDIDDSSDANDIETAWEEYDEWLVDSADDAALEAAERAADYAREED